MDGLGLLGRLGVGFGVLVSSVWNSRCSWMSRLSLEYWGCLEGTAALSLDKYFR